MDSTDRCVCVTRATWAAVNQGALLPTATRAHLRMCSQWCWTTIRHCYFCGGLRNGNEWMTYTWHCPYLRTHEIHYYYFLLVLTKLITAFEKFRRTIRNRSEYGNNKFTASTDWLQVENSCQDKSDCGWVRLFRIHSVAPFPSRVRMIFLAKQYFCCSWKNYSSELNSYVRCAMSIHSQNKYKHRYISISQPETNSSLSELARTSRINSSVAPHFSSSIDYWLNIDSLACAFRVRLMTVCECVCVRSDSCARSLDAMIV